MRVGRHTAISGRVTILQPDLNVSMLDVFLHAQAQEVAQMAIRAKEAGSAAAKLLEETRDELQATQIVHAKLETEIAELLKMIEECKSGDVDSDALTDPTITQTVDMKDLESGEDTQSLVLLCGADPNFFLSP